MRTPTKFVQELNDEQQDRLKSIMKSNASQRTRMRAHAVLLSYRRFSIDRIAAIYEVDRDRVSQWLEWWSEFGTDGLDDDQRPGRPPKLNREEQAAVIEIITEEPRSCRRAAAEIAARLKKKGGRMSWDFCARTGWIFTRRHLKAV